MGFPIIIARQTDFQKPEQNIDFFIFVRIIFLYDVRKTIVRDFYKNSFSISNTVDSAYLKSENPRNPI